MLGCGLCLNRLLFRSAQLPVPAFSEEGRQQTADHAAEAETLQESNHPRLQDVGCGSHQHG